MWFTSLGWNTQPAKWTWWSPRRPRVWSLSERWWVPITPSTQRAITTGAPVLWFAISISLSISATTLSHWENEVIGSDGGEYRFFVSLVKKIIRASPFLHIARHFDRFCWQLHSFLYNTPIFITTLRWSHNWTHSQPLSSPLSGRYFCLPVHL